MSVPVENGVNHLTSNLGGQTVSQIRKMQRLPLNIDPAASPLINGETALEDTVVPDGATLAFVEAIGRRGFLTETLDRAVEKVATELPDYEQDEIGRWLLYTIDEDDKRWDANFARTEEKLRRLADSALEAYRRDLAEPLDPEKV